MEVWRCFQCQLVPPFDGSEAGGQDARLRVWTSASSGGLSCLSPACVHDMRLPPPSPPSSGFELTWGMFCGLRLDTWAVHNGMGQTRWADRVGNLPGCAALSQHDHLIIMLRIPPVHPSPVCQNKPGPVGPVCSIRVQHRRNPRMPPGHERRY